MIVPLIRRRQRLVEIREAASNALAGHVADSIAQRRDGSRVRARAGRGGDPRAQRRATTAGRRCARGTTRTLRVDIVTSPMYVLTNPLGLVVALGDAPRTRREPRGGVPHLQLLRAATRVMWEFNRIYRNLEAR